MALLLLAAPAWADGDEDLGQIYAEHVAGGGVATAGIGLSGRYDGVRNMTGTLVLSDVPAGATVERAWLYWSTWLDPDADPTFSGQAITGTLIGTSADTGWGMGSSSYAFRADVTAIVTQNGSYLLEGLQSSPLNGDVNGAGLLVVYSDPAAVTSATIVVSDGARTWCGAGPFTEDFSGIALPEAPTAATFGLHVADGQDASGATQLPDSDLDFGSLGFTATFDAADDGMWDRDTFDVLTELTAATTTASWTYQNNGMDCVQFVSSWLEIRWPDGDADLASDANDNCPAVANPSQTDTDNDGVGDACSTPLPPDMGMDMGAPDLGAPDVGAPDLGSPDLGAADLGLPDVGAADLGSLDQGFSDLGAADLGGAGQGDLDSLDGADLPGEPDADILPPPNSKNDPTDGCCATAARSPVPGVFLLLFAALLAWRRRRP